MGGTPPRALRL